MYVNKWYTLAASAVLQLVAGYAYTFSLYAPSLKAALHLTQPELEGVGSAILCGGLSAWIPGLLYDGLAEHHKLAPRLTAGIGILTHAVGYATIWAAASGRISLPYWGLIAAGLLASSGLLWLDTAAIVTSMRNFPTERGSVAGILKTFLGLSASIATTIYGGLFAPRGLDYLLFLALAPAALGLLAILFINHVPHMEQSEVVHPNQRLTTEQRLLAICGVISLLLVYQMATALLGRSARSDKFVIMVAAVAFLAAAVLMIPIGTGSLRSQAARLHQGAADDTPLLAAPEPGERLHRRTVSAPLEAGASCGDFDESQGPEDAKPSATTAPRELTLPQCLCSVDYWMLWLALFIGIGSGFTLLNNFGQHVEALRGAEGGQQVYVLLFATFNCLGRMLSGFGSEWLLHRCAVPRTALLLGLSAATAAVYFVVAFAGLAVLLVCSALAGLAFGAHWALMPVCTSELFGSKHFAANQSIMHLSTAIGALVLSAELTGTLFDERGRSHGDPRGACFGPDCFRAAYLVIGGLALLQTGLSTALLLRSRQLYWQLHVQLRRLELETHS